jgi:hypothetical protein
VLCWPPVRWQRANHTRQLSFPSILACCCVRHHARSSAVVQCSQRTLSHKPPTKMSCRVTCLSSVATLGPCFWTTICYIIKIRQCLTGFGISLQISILIVPHTKIFISLLPAGWEGEGSDYYANTWILASATAHWPCSNWKPQQRQQESIISTWMEPQRAYS